MIQVRELSRSYGELIAVDRVSFDIGRREIVGLLGHNGAGKTTIMKMITGFLEPSSGSVTIDDQDLGAHRRAVQGRIGYLPENCPLYTDMTVVDQLDYQAALRDMPVSQRGAAIRQAIERTELGAKASAQVATLSRGYRQRLGVALAILHEPDILILDEPTNGLDPSQIQHMRSLIRELAGHATVIISTHILQEVEAICGRVLIMRAGQLSLDSDLGAIGARPRLLVTLDRGPDEAREMLGCLDGITAVAHLDDQGLRRRYALSAEDPAAVAPRIANAVATRGWALYGLEQERRDLEALFGAVSSAPSDSLAPGLVTRGATEVAHV
ncbi:MAG: ATP-binding cassette domain-containing protein [Thiohalocapsa sp.]